MKKNIIYGFIAFMVCVSINAQIITKSSIDSGGASSTNSGLSVVYTLGEVNVDEVTLGTISISEGFIQSTDASNFLYIEDDIFDSVISLYPNPATNKLFVRGNIDSLEFIALYSVTGQLISKTDFRQQEIDVSALESGVYFLKITNAQTQKVLRFVKQ